MKKILKKSNILIYIFLYVLFLSMHYLFSINFNNPVIYVSDMAGYVGNARFFLYGYNLPALHCHVYYPGYSFLLMPAILLAKNDFFNSFKFIQLTNSLLLSFIPILIYQLIPATRINIDTKTKILITIAISCYPTYILYSNLIMSEAILFPLFLLLTLMVYKLSQNSNRLVYWVLIPMIYGCLYLCTPRALSILPALFISLFLTAYKEKKYKELAISILFFIPGFTATYILVNKLNFYLLQSFFTHQELGDTYNIKNLISFVHFGEFFSIFLAHISYLILSTYGFILIGLYYLIDKINIKHLKTDSTYVVNLFILFAFLSTLATSALYFSIYHSSIEHFINGRYIEMTIIPVYIIALTSFLNNNLSVKNKLILIIINFDLLAFTYLRFGQDLQKLDGININILGIYAFKFLPEHLNLLHYGFLFLCISILIFIFANKSKRLSIIILAIISLAVSITINIELLQSSSKKENITEMMKTISLYSKVNHKIIINFDIPKENFTYHETPVRLRDNNYFAYLNYTNFLPVLAEYYKYQLYFPKIRVNRLNSGLREKPLSDLVVSNRNNIGQIYPGAIIITGKSESVKLWLLPGRNSNVFSHKYIGD